MSELYEFIISDYFNEALSGHQEKIVEEFSSDVKSEFKIDNELNTSLIVGIIAWTSMIAHENVAIKIIVNDKRDIDLLYYPMFQIIGNRLPQGLLNKFYTKRRYGTFNKSANNGHCFSEFSYGKTTDDAKRILQGKHAKNNFTILINPTDEVKKTTEAYLQGLHPFENVKLMTLY